jgi:hypothetical protein
MNQFITVYSGDVILAGGTPYPASGDSQARQSDVGIGVIQAHKLVSGFQRIAAPSLGHIVLRGADWVTGAVVTVHMFGRPHRYFRLTPNSTVFVSDSAVLTGHFAAIRYDD